MRILVNYWTDSKYKKGHSFIVDGVKSFGQLDEILHKKDPEYIYADYWDLKKYPSMEDKNIETITL